MDLDGPQPPEICLDGAGRGVGAPEVAAEPIRGKSPMLLPMQSQSSQAAAQQR